MKLTIHHDDCADSPREFSEATLICWHSRYNLGDEHGYSDPEEFIRELACEHDHGLEDWIEYQENDVYDEMYEDRPDPGAISKFIHARITARCEDTVDANYAMLPVYMYDHSGVALSTSGFSCPWDSGQVGYIYFTNDQVNKWFGGSRERAERALEMEVAIYGAHVNGEVYGYTVEDDDGEVVDSCFGFIGSDHRTSGLREAVIEGGNDFDALIDEVEYA